MSEPSAEDRPDDTQSALTPSRADVLLSSIADIQREMNRLAARQLAEIAEFVECTPSARGAPLELDFELHCGRRRCESQIELARELITRLPKTFEAMQRGELDVFRASKIVEPTTMLTDEQAREVDDIMAGRFHGKDPVGLRRSTNAAVRKVDPDGYEERCKARRQNRRVELSHGDEGMSSIWAYLPTEVATSIYARVDRIARRLRSKSDPRTLEEIRADVFADLCLRGECGMRVPPKAEVFLYLDLFTYLGLNNHAAEMAGAGLIPASLARKIAQDENTILRRIVTDPLTGQPIDVGRNRYRPPAVTDEFVRVRDRECRTPGCHRPTQACDLDHVKDWGKHGVTNDGNLCGLCRRDHLLKNEPKWDYSMNPETGTLTIKTPTGRTYTSDPAPLHEPRRKPDFVTVPPF